MTTASQSWGRIAAVCVCVCERPCVCERVRALVQLMLLRARPTMGGKKGCRGKSLRMLQRGTSRPFVAEGLHPWAWEWGVRAPSFSVLLTERPQAESGSESCRPQQPCPWPSLFHAFPLLHVVPVLCIMLLASVPRATLLSLDRYRAVIKICLWAADYS